MKLAFYGVSCCGKDTLINALLTSGLFNRYEHPRGSTELKKIALQFYGQEFSNLSEEQKNDVRGIFIKQLEQRENIFVDGHYCFPEKDDFRLAFTQSDLELYDIFFYVKADASDIKKRITLSEKNQKYTYLTINDIIEWQTKEISELRDTCFKAHKEFIIIDADYNNLIPFISNIINNFGERNSLSQAKYLVQIIPEKCNKVALFDCDRTIIQEDSGNLFFEKNALDLDPVKKIFDGDCYSQYQFYKYKQLYASFIEIPEPRLFHLNNDIIDVLKALRQKGYMIVGVTSGIGAVWKKLDDYYAIFDKLISNDITQGLIISDFTKGYIAQILVNCGKNVFACGDSLADIYMLESSSLGVIYAPQKIRSSVANYLNTHLQTKIEQFAFNPIKYENIGDCHDL